MVTGASPTLFEENGLAGGETIRMRGGNVVATCSRKADVLRLRLGGGGGDSRGSNQLHVLGNEN